MIGIVLLCLAQPLTGTARAQPNPHGSSTAAEGEIRNATLRFYVALNSAFHSDLNPMSATWSHRADVSNLSSVGGRAVGWNDVHGDFKNMARMYPGGSIAPSDIIIVAGKDIGYSVCTETGQLRSPEGPMVSFNQRATNIFRLEDGKWKMIHHHVDPSSAASQGPTR
jgi:ketosteroid isomerase-like protein